MDFMSDSDSRKSSRAERREREYQMKKDKLEKKQDVKEAKRMSRSSSERAILPVNESAISKDILTPEKSSKQARSRSQSEGPRKKDSAGKQTQGPTCPREDAKTQEFCDSKQTDVPTHNLKLQCKISKYAMKRQEQMDRAEAEKQAKAAAMEKEREEAAFEADAKAAAARRKASWEAKEAAVEEALRLEAQLKALADEAESARKAVAVSNPDLIDSSEPNDDPDLDDWIVLSTPA